MPTRQELEAAFIAADDAGNTEDAQAFADALRSYKDPRSFGDSVAHGARQLASGFADVGTTLLAPYDLAADAVQGRAMGTGNRERRASINAFADNPDPGLVDTLTRGAPEILATGGPIAGVEKAVAGTAPRFLKRALGAGADVGINSAYAAAQAAAKGEDPATAALYGAGGAAAGRALPRALGIATAPVRGAVNRLTSGITPEAAQLVAAGAVPTPGQAAGPGIVQTLENASKHLPGYGSAVQRAQQRTGASYAGAELQDAMAPLGVKIDENGLKAVARANAILKQHYDQIVPQTHWTPQDLDNAVQVSRGALDNNPFLNDAQRAGFLGWVNQNVEPILQAAKQPGIHSIDGRIARDVDIRIGELVRKFNAGGPEQHALADAFSELQRNLRGALDAADPAVKAQLKATNQAFANMVPVATAFDRAGGKVPTPNQFRQAAQKGGALDISGGPLNDAAMEVIDPRMSGGLTRSVMGSAATIAHPAALAGIAAGSLVGHAVYSERGVRMLLAAMQMPAKSRAWVNSLPPMRQAEYIVRLMKQDPLTRQMAAQVGRQLAAEQQEEAQ